MHPDDKVLSLGDVLLRRSDVDLLTGPYWLNDQVNLRRACVPCNKKVSTCVEVHVTSSCAVSHAVLCRS